MASHRPFYRGAESDVQPRTFRIPGSYTDLFVGNAVKALFDHA